MRLGIVLMRKLLRCSLMGPLLLPDAGHKCFRVVSPLVVQSSAR